MWPAFWEGSWAFGNDLLAGQAGKYELGTIFDGIHGDGVRRFYDEHAGMALRNTIILGYILAGGFVSQYHVKHPNTIQHSILNTDKNLYSIIYT